MRNICNAVLLTCALALPPLPGFAQSNQDRAALSELTARMQADWQRGPTPALLDTAIRGLTLAEKVYGPDSVELLNYMGSIVTLRYALGQGIDNLPLLERMFAIGNANLPPENEGVLRTKSDLGRMLGIQNPYRSRTLTREAYETALAQTSDAHPLTVYLAENYANVLIFQGEAETALPLQQRTMQFQRQAMAAGQLPNIAYVNSYLQNLFALGHYATASDVVSETLPPLANVPPHLIRNQATHDQMLTSLRTLRAVAQIANGAPDDQPTANATLRDAMRTMPPTPFEMISSQLFGALIAGQSNDRPETSVVLLRALRIARSDPQIPVVTEAGLVHALFLTDPETYRDELHETRAKTVEQLAPDDLGRLTLESYAASLLLHDGDVDQAQKLNQSISERAKAAGHLQLELATIAAQIDIARIQQNGPEAVRLGEQATRLAADIYGPDSVAALDQMGRQAETLFALNRLEESDKLVETGLAQASTALGNDHPVVARFLVLKAQSLMRAHQPDVARTYVNRGLAILERTSDHTDPTFALARLLHLSVLLTTPENPETKATAQALVTELESQGEDDNPLLAMARMVLTMTDLVTITDPEIAIAKLDVALEKVTSAMPGQEHLFGAFFVARAMAVTERDPIAGLAALDSLRSRFGDQVLDAFGQDALAVMLDQANLTGDAVAYYRRGLDQMLSASSNDPTALLKFTRRLAHLQLRDPDLFQGDDTMDAFHLLQWPLERQAGTALELAARRFSLSDPALSGMLRQQQDLAAQVAARDADLRLAYAGDNTDAVIALQSTLSNLRTQQTALETRLRSDAPDFSLINGGEPLGSAEVADLLTEGEALLLLAPTQYTQHDDIVPGIAYLVRWDGQTVAAPLNEFYIHSSLLRYLRCDIDWDDNFCIWQGDNEDRAEVSVTSTPTSTPLGTGKRGAFDINAPASGFDFEAAHDAYQELIAPIEHGLDGITHLLFVPGDATMSALPVGLLVREPLPPALSPEQSLRQASWLIRDMAVTMLPTVSSLATQRGPETRASRATKPFLGVGDPVIGTPAQIDCSTITTAGLSRSLGDASTADLVGDTLLSNVDRIRRLARLPDTRCELQEIQSRLGGGTLLLDHDATEASLKQLNDSNEMAQYRVLSFATHGLVAGEAGAAEPALVLTPPDTASTRDDGLLTASEIATFDLDADLVMLSACNTAAGSDNGGEALSGLARAFFYAGARRVLVSHWPVNSDAAVTLTTATMQQMTDGAETNPSQALRQAILSILDDPNSSLRELHPQHWGPFSLVGTTR